MDKEEEEVTLGQVDITAITTITTMGCHLLNFCY